MKKIKGYYSTQKLLKQGFNSRQIHRLVQDGTLLRIKQGLYRNTLLFVQDQSFVDVCKAMPYAVITSYSALSYYGLTTFIPQEVFVSIPKGRKAPAIYYPPVHAIRQNKEDFKADILKIKRETYFFYIYTIEKVVCDTLKARKKMGMDTVKEVLQNYLKRPDKNLPKLYQTAQKYKVFTILNEFLSIMR